MDLIGQYVDVLLHLDRHLGAVIADFGIWTYLILFAIVFCETGLVVMPFLPGDSLLFAVGTYAALGYLDIHKVWPLLEPIDRCLSYKATLDMLPEAYLVTALA